jgi:predicted TPR repeat methyltransferase
MVMRRAQCSLCRGTRLEEVMAFPDTPLANEFVKEKDADKPQEKFPLRLVMCRSCQHVQIGELVDPARLFDQYVYVTGTSKVTVAHLREQANEVLRRHSKHDREKLFVVEVGSNDGTLLKEFQRLGVGRVLGVDPATDIVAIANADGVPTVRDFFSAETADTIVSDYRRADIVVANNVLAHVPDVRSVVEAVRKLLVPGGLFVFDVAHLLDVVNHFAFDTIYHEHFSYHTILPIIRMVSEADMRVVSVDRIDGQVGRGSLRIWVIKEPSSSYVPSQIVRLVDVEKKAGLYEYGYYRFLSDKITYRGAAMKRSLKVLAERGPIIGFGAPAKLTTLMYAYDLDKSHCSMIFDDSPWKAGLFTPGVHIPVFPSSNFEAYVKENKPGSMVIWAWNFSSDIIKRYAEQAARHKIKLVVPLPLYTEIENGIGASG